MIDPILSMLRNDVGLWVYVGFAMSAFLVVTGIFQLLSRQENSSEARSRRMAMITKGATAEQVLAVLKPRVQKTGWERLPIIGAVPGMMRQAGIVAPPSRFLMICATLTIVVATALSTQLSLAYALICAIILGIALPMFVLRTMRDRRLDRLIVLLPDALDQMARGLRVGHPLNTSIASVATEMPDPVGTEFGLIADQISYGDDLVDAVQEFAERVDLEDVHYLSASIAIQHGTGGDLAAIVDTLSRVVRDRIALRRRVKAISAEGRLTAYFLTAVPFLIFGLNMVSNPDYYMGVAEDPLFRPMAIAIVILVIANATILRKLANIRY